MLSLLTPNTLYLLVVGFMLVFVTGNMWLFAGPCPVCEEEIPVMIT